MINNNENDILFDDVEILTRLTGKSDINIVSSNNDCDCSNYKPTLNQKDCDTDQISLPIGQTS